MADINAQFTRAQEDVKQLPERPGNLTLLRLYALFKQATEGDVHGDKPGFTDIVGKYKYDAWAQGHRSGRREAAIRGTRRIAQKRRSGVSRPNRYNGVV